MILEKKSIDMPKNTIFNILVKWTLDNIKITSFMPMGPMCLDKECVVSQCN